MAFIYGCAKLGKPVSHRAPPEVRTRDLEAHVQQYFGYPAHADAADADEVRVL
jgi:hypothetical protein